MGNFRNKPETLFISVAIVSFSITWGTRIIFFVPVIITTTRLQFSNYSAFKNWSAGINELKVEVFLNYFLGGGFGYT